jgi:hypothetical protein
MRAWQRLDAVVNVRKTAADVVALADLAIYGAVGQQGDAFRRLPERLRALQRRAQRCLDALEAEQGT